MKVTKNNFILAMALLIAFSAFMPITKATEPDAGANGAVLMDAKTRRVLLSQGADRKLPMASTTKVMTALIALETVKPDTIITVPKEAYGAEGSSMYLNLGEKLTMEDLLYGLMLTSGNDAAITIAVHIGGSVERFAEIMNSRAKEIGALSTNFVTPNGLHDENHYTTAYDLALICCAAMENNDFRTIVNTQYWRTKSGDVIRTLKSKNRILWEYDGGNGIKTGFTKAAGRCVTFSAGRSGNTLIGVVLGCPDMWNSAKSMLDYGFSEYKWEIITPAGEPIETIRVEQGMAARLAIVAKEDIIIPLKHNESAGSIEIRVDCPSRIKAPVYAGQTIGKIEAWLDGRLLSSTELLAQSTVYKKDYSYYLDSVLRNWIA